MTRALALVLAFGIARAEDVPTVEVIAPRAAPEKTAVLRWRYGETVTEGVWLSENQSKRLTERLTYWQDETERARIEAARASVPWWLWLGAGVVVGGAAGAAIGARW